MKSFLELLEEQQKTKNPVVMTFGRFNPPTTGHLKLIDKVRSEAEKRHAKHLIVVSHSQDAKKNPLTSAQKLKHLKRYSPGTNFEAATKEAPSLIQQAERLHKAGHDHLIMVAGSDRVKEYQQLLNKYNGKADKNGHVPYNFKKIEVVSAGHRDPDAEGAEGMSGTKMREHAKNNDFSSFRQGVPHHVPDNQARELMKDTRKGMGLNESVDRGIFKAIFVTGGPGSGKDVVIREAIPESRAVELNTVQAFDYLADKQKLTEKSQDYRREAIRNRGPLIINGPAEDYERISYIKEELEELGYNTLMIFVNTSNQVSQERNTKLSRMMVESVRYDKWLKAQKNYNDFDSIFEHIILFDNSGSMLNLEENIHEIYQTTDLFIETPMINESSEQWLLINKRNKLISENVKKNSKSIQTATVKKYNTRFEPAKGPADIKPDNMPSTGTIDTVKGNTFPRKDPNGKGHSGGAWSGAYSTEESTPTLSKRPEPKESNFSQDKDRVRRKKFGDSSLSASRVGRPSGIGQEYETRAGGQGAAAGAGLGDQTYSEDREYSNAQPSSSAMPGSSSVQPNPLAEKKPFNKFKKSLKKEAIDDPGIGDSGVGGVLGGAGNKEVMSSYKDTNRNIQNDYGLKIKKKKKVGEK